MNDSYLLITVESIAIIVVSFMTEGWWFVFNYDVFFILLSIDGSTSSVSDTSCHARKMNSDYFNGYGRRPRTCTYKLCDVFMRFEKKYRTGSLEAMIALTFIFSFCSVFGKFNIAKKKLRDSRIHVDPKVLHNSEVINSSVSFAIVALPT